MLDELGGFDVFTAQSVDPWRVLVEVVESGEDGLRRGREFCVSEWSERLES